MSNVRAFRVFRTKYADSALSGDGAKRMGGRWNPVGLPCLYTSDSLALAALEVLVHTNQSISPDLSCLCVTLPSQEVETLAPASLPKNWPDSPREEVRSIGEAWLRSRRSLALRVPSVIITSEFNLLINPEHPAFPQLKADYIQPFILDARLLSVTPAN